MLVDITRLLKGIVLQGVACFGKLNGAANLLKGNNFDKPLQGSGDLFDFFSVVGGETDFHGLLGWHSIMGAVFWLCNPSSKIGFVIRLKSLFFGYEKTNRVLWFQER